LASALLYVSKEIMESGEFALSTNESAKGAFLEAFSR
jgi:hypothetical protein